MTESFVLDLGFSLAEYAVIIKGLGLAATLLGGFAGGFIARAYPMATSLWIGGILQAAANLTFSAQAMIGHNSAMLAFAITAENFTSAIGTVIYVAYLVGAVPQPAAHGNAIRAAHRALGVRPHLSLRRRRLCGGRYRLGQPSSRSAPQSRFRAWCCWPGCSGADISGNSRGRLPKLRVSLVVVPAKAGTHTP